MLSAKRLHKIHEIETMIETNRAYIISGHQTSRKKTYTSYVFSRTDKYTFCDDNQKELALTLNYIINPRNHSFTSFQHSRTVVTKNSTQEGI